MFRIGVDGGGGYHYMLQTDKAANDLEGHSHGFHAYVMGVVRFQWEPFAKDEEKKRETVEQNPVPLDDPLESEGSQEGAPPATEAPPAQNDPPQGGAAEPTPSAEEPAEEDAGGEGEGSVEADGAEQEGSP
jgi:hypothetical protein